MKKIFYISFLGLVLAACQKADNAAPADNDAPEFVYAHTEGDDSKTTVSENETSCSIFWEAEDKIARFGTDGYVRRYYLTGGAGTKDGTFSSNAGTPGGIGTLSKYVAYTSLPVDGGVNDQITCSESEGRFTISHEHSGLANQTYKPDAFDYRAFPMVAVSEDGVDFKFKNVCGGLLLKLKGTSKIRTVALQGNGSEVLSGAYTVTASADQDPVIDVSGVGKSISLSCGNSGCQLDEETATNFYMSVPPVSFGSGFNVTLTDTDGFTRTYNSGAEIEIGRSQVLAMPEITFPYMEFDLSDPKIGTGTTYDKGSGLVTFTGTSDRYIQFNVGNKDISAHSDLALVIGESNFTVKIEVYTKNGTKTNYCGSPGVSANYGEKTYPLTGFCSADDLSSVEKIRIGLNEDRSGDDYPKIQIKRAALL